MGERLTPHYIKIDFDLFELSRFPLISRFAPALCARFRERITVEPSPVADFCLSIERAARTFPSFPELFGTLSGVCPGDVLFGVDENNAPIVRNIRAVKSLLCAGTSGAGKSFLLHNIIKSLLSAPVDLVRLNLIDLKKCEFAKYESDPHLDSPIATQLYDALFLLRGLKKIIDNRYIEMQKRRISKADISDFPVQVCIIDEYAELAYQTHDKTELDRLVARIASLGRACNVFLVIATQHAVNDVISNTIKSNLQSRVGLRTTNNVQSMCVLGVPDCKTLLGSGDALIAFDGEPQIIRAQICDVNTEPTPQDFPDSEKPIEDKIEVVTKVETVEDKPKKTKATRTSLSKLSKIVSHKDTHSRTQGYAIKDGMQYFSDGFFCSEIL